MGGILAKTYGDYRQRRHRRWKLQVCFTKFGTITIREIIGEIDDKIEEKDVESQYIMYVFRDMDKLNPTGEMNGDSV